MVNKTFPVYSISLSGLLSWQLHALNNEGNGAKRNTNLPHPDYFEGMIAVSTRRCPAPMISPLEESYNRPIEGIANTLNSLNGVGTVHLFRFESMAEFAQRIEELIAIAQPWERDYAEAIE